MNVVYPVIISQTGKDEFFVQIPDMEICTQGESLENAIFMARDAISLMALDMEDEGRKLPAASELSSVKTESPSDIVTLVDADIAAYRRMLNNRSVRKNCTIPSWLNELAEQANINFSAVLQNALKEQLNIR